MLPLKLLALLPMLSPQSLVPMLCHTLLTTTEPPHPYEDSPAEPASPAVVAEPVSTNAVPIATTPSPVCAQAGDGHQPVTPDHLSTPLPQTSPTRAALASTFESFSFKTKKAAAAECSAAAQNIKATSASAAATPRPPDTAAHQSKLSTTFALPTTPAHSEAQSQDTIPAVYQQQQQQVPRRPSKDNLFVARREGFTEVKLSGRRTEEEKARGVQRSPDSLLMKWGQHPSQLV